MSCMPSFSCKSCTVMTEGQDKFIKLAIYEHYMLSELAGFVHCFSYVRTLKSFIVLHDDLFMHFLLHHPPLIFM